MTLVGLNYLLVVISLIMGLFLGGLVMVLRQQKQLNYYESKHRLDIQRIQQYQQQLTELEAEIKGNNAKFMICQQQLNEQSIKLATITENAQQQMIARNEWREECEKLNQELRIMREINSAQEAELREVTTRLEESHLAHDEKQRQLINSEQRLQIQFENLANKIFEQASRKVDEQNQQSLNNLLIPLREQLDVFRRQVQDSFSQDMRERHTLTHEIRQLQQLNAQMAQEAINLTNALKGNNKTQGNWGEVVLSRVFELSGLRQNYEYHVQINLKSEKGARQQPDAIVHLPQGKDIIVDAKMSLVAYERFFNCSDETVRQQALGEHIASIRQHIRQLGAKDYQTLPGIRTLDYILMFIPIEPAFLLAIEHEPELINEALGYNIMLVSPTTLLVALRTINNLWRYEHQSQNAKQIADRAARLYDKVRLFVDDMTMLGQSLDKASNYFHYAMNKLAQGRGNLLTQVEHFRQLGVDVKRPINQDIVKLTTDLTDKSNNITLSEEDKMPKHEKIHT